MLNRGLTSSLHSLFQIPTRKKFNPRDVIITELKFHPILSKLRLNSHGAKCLLLQNYKFLLNHNHVSTMGTNCPK